MDASSPPSTAKPYRIVFVCTGNICRSPTAHAVLRHKLSASARVLPVEVDSAGTHAYHAGQAADPRSQAVARQRGYDLSDLRARQLTKRDFERADLVLVMDDDNLLAAAAQCPAPHRHKLRRLVEFCRRHPATHVADPYYGGTSGFEQVLDVVEDACDGLLEQLRDGPRKPGTLA